MRRISIFIFVFLLFNQQQSTLQLSQLSQLHYGLDEAIEDISFFIPGAKFVLTVAIRLYSVYGEARQMFAPNATEIEKSLKRIEKNIEKIKDCLGKISDQIDVVGDEIKEVNKLISEKVVDSLPKEFGLDIKMISIYSHINKVKDLFEKFMLYTDPSEEFRNDTLISFADSVIADSLNEMPSVLRQIHDTLIEDSSGVNMLDLLGNPRLSKIMMCKRKQSSQYYLNSLYNNIMKTEIKGLLMTQYAYAVKEKYNHTSYKSEFEAKQNAFYKRTSISNQALKKAMQYASREVYLCDPPVYDEGRTFMKLGPIFQAYITHEKDANVAEFLKKMVNACTGTCQHRNNVADLCRSDFCKEHGKKCQGYLRDCKAHDSKLKICLDNTESAQRYQYVELVNKNQIFGQKNSCSESSEVSVQNNFHWFRSCEYCFCTCESIRSNMDRYFNLRDVVADVKDNKIITGVRFVKENNIFHIRIEQGQLLQNGNVNKSTVNWKSVDNYTVYDDDVIPGVDYHTISWNERTVLLDSIEAPTNNLLTGLRFRLANQALKLEIQTTQFDFYSGRLKTNESKWRSEPYNIDKRTEIKIENRNVPTTSCLNLPNTNGNQFIKFTISSMETDIGQTVVPFIDSQPIVASQPVPLSGAGLMHRGDPNTAGFLALKLFTYNFAPYLQT